MKKSIYLLVLLLVGAFFFASCSKKKDPLNDPNQLLYQSLCSASNGTLDLKIGGKQWGNSCAIATDYGASIYGSDSLLINIASYTGDGVYLNNGSFEWFTIYMFITNGTGTYDLVDDYGSACYYSGIFIGTGSTGSQDPEVFCSDTSVGDDNRITITSINGTRIKGKFDLVAFNEDGQSLDMEGEFDVDYVE